MFRPYAKQIAKDRQTYKDFLTLHEYDLAQQFFARYRVVNSSWSQNFTRPLTLPPTETCLGGGSRSERPDRGAGRFVLPVIRVMREIS